ncbi:MAG: 2-hydroxychromene-2-carboxylate isomerase [Candidatus Binatus sp.]|jgi:2-hydroxychromene-2-carboxylate isomerase|uniref:2-hydroxychromene-2-carboxylate isomerase n=1 Tax=Candidatus Binatus sp. TaxID=2811406 RepID=UPI003D0E3DB3
MPKKLEFFYDCSSPWTYLAFTKIEDVARRHDAELIWRPILVGGLFNTVNPSVYESRAKPVPVKARYYVKDLADWARFYGLKIGNPTVFPVNSVKAMRGAFVADEHRVISRYSRRVFESYWTDDKDISKDDVLREIVRETGLDEKEFFTKIASDEYKAKLRQNVEELIARGGFGSPTMFVEGSMFFGNDRLPLVEHELAVGVGGALDEGSGGST